MPFDAPQAKFDPNWEKILEQIDAIDPIRYAKTRNFADGAVTRLSPFISRGVISTRRILQHVLQRNYPFNAIEKFVQELAWRDYWQQVWIAKGDAINTDLKRPQPDVLNHQMPTAIEDAHTGIEAIDAGITELYTSGYMHNHMRMYTAALACNNAKSHWRLPAQWMYYHLLDGDWASNALSWQWVAGSNANKKYIANQTNINKYFYSQQQGSFLDLDYAELAKAPVPQVLKQTSEPKLTVDLPGNSAKVLIDPDLPTLVYNYYNLDPTWRESEPANRVLLLEPSVFNQYPVSKHCIEFVLKLAQNIPGVQILVAEFSDLHQQAHPGPIVFKEHPLNNHYRGTMDERDWMFTVTGYYPSFFAFWKRCKKEIQS